MRAALALLVLLAAGLPARAQDAFERQVYGQVEAGARREYDHLLESIKRDLARDPNIDKSDEKMVTALFEREKARLRLLTYNKASLFTHCSGEAQRARGPSAPRVPLQQNLMMQSCLEIKLQQMTQFANIASYAGHFFPERIAPCGDQFRQKEREQRLPPYDFLNGDDELKLYDFEGYVKCMMTVP